MNCTKYSRSCKVHFPDVFRPFVIGVETPNTWLKALSPTVWLATANVFQLLIHPFLFLCSKRDFLPESGLSYIGVVETPDLRLLVCLHLLKPDWTLRLTHWLNMGQWNSWQTCECYRYQMYRDKWITSPETQAQRITRILREIFCFFDLLTSFTERLFYHRSWLQVETCKAMKLRAAWKRN